MSPRIDNLKRAVATFSARQLVLESTSIAVSSRGYIFFLDQKRAVATFSARQLVEESMLHVQRDSER